MFHNNGAALIRSIKDRQRHSEAKNVVSSLLNKLAKLRYHFWSTVTSSDIHPDVKFGEDVLLPHPTGVVIHGSCRIGDRCMIMQQVTLGQLSNTNGPLLGDDVYIGAGAKVLGEIKIGASARIGANAVVLTDVPINCTAVGIPAKIIL